MTTTKNFAEVEHADDDDAAKFEMMAGHVRTIAEAMLTEFFGERCEIVDSGCPCCQRWKLLDQLTVNPFKGD